MNLAKRFASLPWFFLFSSFCMSFDPYFLIALVIVITIHEFSHAVTANFFGDPTAKVAGRISLNPFAHLDILGTLMLFLIHIGWGKPVPVNPRYFRYPKRDEALTALAGPASNLLFALILALPVKYLGHSMIEPLARLLNTTLDVSILLFAFNMLPFPPLDGSKILGLLVPQRFHLAYQRYLYQGVLYFALFLLFDQFVLLQSFNLSILQFFIGTIFTFVKSLVFFGYLGLVGLDFGLTQ